MLTLPSTSSSLCGEKMEMHNFSWGTKRWPLSNLLQNTVSLEGGSHHQHSLHLDEGWTQACLSYHQTQKPANVFHRLSNNSFSALMRTLSLRMNQSCKVPSPLISLWTISKPTLFQSPSPLPLKKKLQGESLTSFDNGQHYGMLCPPCKLWEYYQLDPDQALMHLMRGTTAEFKFWGDDRHEVMHTTVADRQFFLFVFYLIV